MLGAVTSGSQNGRHSVSVPPRPAELTDRGLRDWKTGIDLLEGCMSTHDTQTSVVLFVYLTVTIHLATYSGLAPEVAQFRSVEDVKYAVSRDWFIPGRSVLSIHHILIVSKSFNLRTSKTGHGPTTKSRPPYEAQYMLRCASLQMARFFNTPLILL